MGAALAAGLVVTACAKSTPTSSGASSSSPTDSGGGTRYGGGYGGGGGITPLPANTVQQGAGGLRFDPAKITVKQGVTLTVTNVGTTDHTFTVVGTNIDIVNAKGASQTVAIDLKPGTYPFICRFHVNLGMKGTLVVTS
jgi:plastocyanin